MDKLVEMIKNSERFPNLKCIYGIPRGGWPIAVHLAHHLELELIESCSLDSLFRKIPSELLIVDDIADTGKTLKKYDWFASATLYYKRRSVIKPTFYVKETENWIVFPWERLDEVPNRPE
jgi:hypoxanthine phosphoribosyltransferase